MADTLVLSLGTQCNSRCRYCLNQSGGGLPFALTEIRARIDRAVSLLDRTDRVVLTGGEPTMLPEIAGTLSLLRDLCFGHIELQSNARAFSSREHAMRLVDAGMTRLFASFAGFAKATHTFVTGHKKAYDETIKGIQNAVALDVDVEVNYVVSTETLDGTIDFADWVQHGIPGTRIRLSICCSKGRAISNSSSPSLMDAVPVILESIERLGLAGVDVTTQYVPLCMMRGMYHASLEAQGPPREVVLCDMQKDDSFVWHGGARQYYRECDGCIARQICPGVAHRACAVDADMALIRPFSHGSNGTIGQENRNED